MPVIRGPEQLAVPEAFEGLYRLEGPQTMSIVGEANEANRIESTLQVLSESTMYNARANFHAAGTGMLVLTLPYGGGKGRIKREHPGNIARGAGIQEGQATETMFVGPRLRKISSESAVWLGRALAAPHIERVYYYQPHDHDLNNGLLNELSDETDGLRVIRNPFAVFRLVPISGEGKEIPYLTARAINDRQETIK